MKIKDVFENIEFETTEWAGRHNNFCMVVYLIFLTAVVFLVLIAPTWMSFLIVGIICLWFSLPISIPMIIHHKEVCRYMKKNAKSIISWTAVMLAFIGGMMIMIM